MGSRPNRQGYRQQPKADESAQHHEAEIARPRGNRREDTERGSEGKIGRGSCNTPPSGCCLRRFHLEKGENQPTAKSVPAGNRGQVLDCMSAGPGCLPRICSTVQPSVEMCPLREAISARTCLPAQPLDVVVGVI